MVCTAQRNMGNFNPSACLAFDKYIKGSRSSTNKSTHT